MPETNELGGAKFDRTRKFGIELEAYNCDARVLSDALNRAGVECAVEGYNHTTRSHWKIVSDASIRGAQPFELVSPPMRGDDGLRQIETVCRVLKENNVKVNRSTGLHVHHDARGLGVENYKSIVTMWWKYEDVIKFFLPPSRRNNFFCAPAMPTTNPEYGRICGYSWSQSSDVVAGWKQAMDRLTNIDRVTSFQPSRYAPVNFHAITKHGTVEFRSHAGTTEYAKIHAWIVLTQWFIIRSISKPCQVRTRMTGRWADDVRFFWRAIDWINLDDAVVVAAKNTLRRRFNHFKELERGGAENLPAGPLHVRDSEGRIRPTDYAAQQEPGEV